MIKYTETYDIATHESAENGDTAENGWYLDGYQYALQDNEGYHPEILEQSRQGDFTQKGTLLDILAKIDDKGMYFNGQWFETVDAEIDMYTGKHTRYYLHVDDILARTAIVFAMTNKLTRVI